MSALKRIYLILFLLYISGLPNRLGLISQPVHEIIMILLALTGLFAFTIYLSKFRFKADSLDVYLMIYLVAYPLFNSIIAWFTRGQPVYMGILTFRSYYILLTYYTLLVFGFSERAILGYVEKTVVFIMILIAVLFCVFNLNDFNIPFRKGNLVIEYTHTTTKGLQFSGFTCLFFIPYIAGWVRFFEKNNPVYLILPALIYIFSIFISKARNEILTISAIPVIMYYLKYKFYDLKFLVITLLLVSIFFITVLTDNVISRNFSGLVKLGDLDYAYETGDYSAYLRIEQLKSGWEWVKKYPVTGVGSISYRFNNGYMGFISDFFYISDIGIMGVLVKGGIILLFFYFMFYRLLINYFAGDDTYSVIGRYIVMALLIELIIGNDYLVNYSGVLVILFLLKQTRSGIARVLS